MNEIIRSIVEIIICSCGVIMIIKSLSFIPIPLLEKIYYINILIGVGVIIALHDLDNIKGKLKKDD